MRNAGVTALMRASQEGHSGIVRILLEKGANPNAKIRSEGCLGFTALMFAAQNGHDDIVRMLQDKEVSPDRSY